jgi:hypothetical protein
MTEAGATMTACLVLALGCTIGALRCLADHLLVSAALYTLIALGFFGGAASAAIGAL